MTPDAVVIHRNLAYFDGQMAWSVRQFSKGEINAAGRHLVDPAQWRFHDDPFEILNNWRSCHGYPLQIVKMTLRKRAKSVDEYALIAQRIKRLSSIRVKLTDNPDMQLARMQDIGGCRAILRRIGEVDRLHRVYRRSHRKDPHSKIRPLLIRTRDYVNEPKADGYRGIHLIMKYQTDAPEKRAFQDQQIEIQLRSQPQHIWATAVETAQTFTGQALKSKIKRANEDWLRFFSLMSTAFAMNEKRAVVPNTPSKYPEVIAELHHLENKESIIEHLEGWSRAMNFHEQSKTPGDLFLMVLDAKERKLSVRPYKESQLAEAEQEYLVQEKRMGNDPQMNAVLVSVDAFRMLRKAYPNYYVDTSAFIKAVRNILVNA